MLKRKEKKSLFRIYFSKYLKLQACNIATKHRAIIHKKNLFFKYNLQILTIYNNNVIIMA